MQNYRPDISHTVERRAQEAAAGELSTVQPSLYPGVRVARKASAKPLPQPSPSAALTRRERRVKDILLKELNRLYGKESGGLTYSEKQHLEKTLNVEFIDKELRKMAKQEQTLRRLSIFQIILTIAVTVPVALVLWKGEPLRISTWLLPLLFLGEVFAFKWQIRSLQRKRFIYEALRELSDADELDVTLDRVAREADALIEQIVERELALDQRYPSRPFVKA